MEAPEVIEILDVSDGDLLKSVATRPGISIVPHKPQEAPKRVMVMASRTPGPPNKTSGPQTKPQVTQMKPLRPLAPPLANGMVVRKPGTEKPVEEPVRKSLRTRNSISSLNQEEMEKSQWNLNKNKENEIKEKMLGSHSKKLVIPIKNINAQDPKQSNMPNIPNVSITVANMPNIPNVSITVAKSTTTEAPKKHNKGAPTQELEEQVDEPEEMTIEDETVEQPEEAAEEAAESVTLPPMGLEDSLTCYICQQIQDEEGRSFNLKNIFFVRSHLSKCMYTSGKLFQSVPPGPNNTDENVCSLLLFLVLLLLLLLLLVLLLFILNFSFSREAP